MKVSILNTIGPEFAPEAKAILARFAEVKYASVDQKRLGKEIGKYDVIICGLGNAFTRDVLAETGKLKAIATATTGLDHLDTKMMAEKGIDVLSLKGENKFLDTISGTAELALGLLIDSARKMSEAYNSVLRGEWRREMFRGHNLRGMTLGIVGLGRLGRMMATYGSALGMDVIFSDPYPSKSNKRWKRVSFQELLKRSDFISIHVHLSPETEYMFDASAFKAVKKGVRIVNTSRGKIVDELSLIQAMKRGSVEGYATDVLDGETTFGRDCSRHPLVKYAKANSDVIIVPHIGGMTFESRRDTDIFIAKKVAAYAIKNGIIK